MAFGGGSKGIKNEINVTPLVDVVLVLLIIFMVITPMLQRGKDVNLPKSEKVDEEKKGDPLVLSVTPDGKTYVEANQVDESALEGKVADALRREPGRKIMLKGDEKVTVGDVRKVMQHARLAGAKGVALAVQEKK
ncbi:MAG: Biopolymer transport protein ExbD/TolR [Labilithrix sp.]|nr:Biopolymer transport protein ExbD/TolR [Labilithrix sp.]